MKNLIGNFYYKYGVTALAVAWICINSSKLLKFWITYENISAAYAEGDGAQRAQLITILFLIIPLLYQRRNKILKILRNNTWLIILFLYALISIAWCEIPVISLKRIFRTFGYILILLAIFTEDDAFKTFLNVLKISAILIIGLSIILILFFPSHAFKTINGESLICGVTSNKNQLGQWCFTAVVFFLWQTIVNNSFKKKVTNCTFLIICSILLINCKSSTSLFMTVVSVFVLSYYYICHKFGWKGFWAAGSIIISAVLLMLLTSEFYLKGSFFDFFFNLIGKDSTFTGRSDIWKQVFELGKEKWLLGHGYGSFWLSPRAELMRYNEDWEMFQAHNGYLDTFLHLGITGCVLTAGYILNGINGIVLLFKVNKNSAILILAYFLSMLFGNFFETIFSIQNHEFWFISLYSCIVYPCVNRPPKKSSTFRPLNNPTQ